MREETVHTTANHPWLTADRGWVLASQLHTGEAVRTLDGRTATVVATRVVPGAAAMWDLTVSNVHDFAVGADRYVVHNCGGELNPKVDHASNFDEARERGFRNAGWTEENAEQWRPTKFDPETGTYVEFEAPGGAKVAYDSPHADMDPEAGHDRPHVGWQTGGKRGAGGGMRGNITYDGPQHPFRSPIMGRGLLDDF